MAGSSPGSAAELRGPAPTAPRAGAVEIVLWVLTGLAGIATLPLCVVMAWASRLPDDGTDYAGMVFGSALITALGLLALTAAFAVGAGLLRWSRVSSPPPPPAVRDAGHTTTSPRTGSGRG